MRSFKLVFGFVIVLLFVVPFVYGGTTGKINGRITDKQTGEGLPAVNVVVEGTNWGAATDFDGYYNIINITPGTYNIVISMIGYSQVKVEGIRVFVDRTSTQEVTLSEEVIEGEAVTIIATRPLVEMDRTNTAAYIDDETIRDLPVQEMSEIIQVQAGVVTGSGGEMHFRGGREREVAYMIDGVPVTNTFSQSGGSNVAIENSIIKELQVISGTFNAEYGSAQSGIINVVTKSPAQQFHGDLQLFGGDNFSNKTDKFIAIDKFNPIAERDIQATLSGPLFKSQKFGFFATARYNQNDGYLYGERRYNPEDGWKINAFRHWFTQHNSGQISDLGRIPLPDSLKTGDYSNVPMASSEKLTFTGKINFIPIPTLGLTYSVFASKSKGQGYSDSWRYAPDGRATGQGSSHQHFLAFRNNPTANLFYNIRLSYQYNHSSYNPINDSKIAEFPGDTGLLPIGASDDQTGFVQGDNQWGSGYNTRKVLMANGDANWQMNKHNFVKLGFEVRGHDVEYQTQPFVATEAWRSYQYTTAINGEGLDFDDFWGLMTDYWRGWNEEFETTKLRPAKTTDGSYVNYVRNPIEFATYIQDKVELGELVLNAGLRFDYFDPRAKTLVNERSLSQGIGNPENLKDATVKTKLSPRLGFSFPISERGAFHVSYGHFFQMPSLEKLFEKPIDESMTSLLLDGARIGDTDLKPEVTIAYELGLQQQLNDAFAMDVTVYYKDIRNQLGIEAVRTVDAVGYTRYINRDYGNVKGFSLALEKLRTGLFSGAVDYTFQYAKGSASDPNFLQLIEVATRLSGQPVQFPERQILPLEWDQRHTMNLTLNFSKPKDWSVSAITSVGSGLPYTPSSVEQLQLPTREFKNSARKPMRFNMDLKASKQLKLAGMDYTLFVRIYNALDNLNEKYVYSATGRASYTARLPIDEQIALEMLQRGGQFTMQEWDNRPSWYSQPRRVQVGLTMRF
jgi:outer membrane receptor protein involved in Fe transport